MKIEKYESSEESEIELDPEVLIGTPDDLRDIIDAKDLRAILDAQEELTEENLYVIADDLL